MNKQTHHQLVKEAVSEKFRGSQPLKSKVTPRYPDSCERELQRIARGYTKIFYAILKEHLSEMMSAYKRERHGDSRFDDAMDLDREIRQQFAAIAKELEQKVSRHGLEGLVEKAGKMAKNASIREWKRIIRNTLGVDLMDDYYNGEEYDRALRKWIDENVLKIRSIPNDALDEMQGIIREGYQKGRTIRDITKEIQREFGVTKNKAETLARDQISTLNAQLTRMQQEDAGCEEYIWSSSGDSRVRDCHRALDGKRIRWDNPPEMWYKTKSKGIVYTGRRCHPGEDYCCRCVAIPYFNLETIDIPIQQATEV